MDEKLDVLETLSQSLVPIAKKIYSICGNNPNIYLALSKTGMPFELLDYDFKRFDERSGLNNKNEQDRINWSNDVVYNGLLECNNRAWYKNLFEDISQDTLFELIRLWMGGAQLNEIENKIPLSPRQRQSHINIGRMLNHRLSMFAQFWGALSTLEKINYPDADNCYLKNIQSYVREGVSNQSQLVWLEFFGRN